MESGEGSPSQPPAGEIVKLVDVPGFRVGAPIAENVAGILSPWEKGSNAARVAVGFLEGKIEDGSFNDNPNLSTSVDSILGHVTDREDGTRRVMDSEGLKQLIPFLSEIGNGEADEIVNELTEDLVVSPTEGEMLNYKDWKNEFDDPATTPERKEALEKAQFGYPIDATPKDIVRPSEETGEEIPGEILSDEKFLTDVITDLEQKIAEKTKNNEDTGGDRNLLGQARSAMEANGKLGPLYRSSVIKGLGRAGYGDSSPVLTGMSEKIEQAKKDFERICVEKGGSGIEAELLLKRMTEGSYVDILTVSKGMDLETNEIFGKKLTNEDFRKMYKDVLKKDELEELFAKDEKNYWGFMLLAFYLSLAKETAGPLINNKGG